MPSSHSQFICFYASYFLLFLVFRLNKGVLTPIGEQRGKSYLRWLDQLLKAMFCVAMVALTSLVLYGRIYLQYHTVEQVVVGAAIGVAVGLFWFLLTQAIFTPYIYPFGKYVWLHDLSGVDAYLAKVDSVMWEAEKQSLLKSKKKRS